MAQNQMSQDLRQFGIRLEPEFACVRVHRNIATMCTYPFSNIRPLHPGSS